jgi:hypothetical protein
MAVLGMREENTYTYGVSIVRRVHDVGYAAEGSSVGTLLEIESRGIS